MFIRKSGSSKRLELQVLCEIQLPGKRKKNKINILDKGGSLNATAFSSSIGKMHLFHYVVRLGR